MVHILSVIAFFCIVVTITQTLYVAWVVRGLHKHLFIGIALSTSIWMTACMFGYSVATVEEAVFWFTISTIGFCQLPAFLLHFCLVITSKKGFVWQHLVLYPPTIIITILGFRGDFVFSSFTKKNIYWIGEASNSLLTAIFTLLYLSFYICSILLLIRHAYKTESVRIKKINVTLALSIAITLLLYNLEPFIFPYFTSYKTTLISPMASIIWVSGVWWAILRYRLFNYSPESLLKYIINYVNFALFISSKDGTVLEKNNIAKKLTKTNGTIITNTNFLVPQTTKQLQESDQPLSNFLLINTRPVLFRAYKKIVEDGFGDSSLIAIAGTLEEMTLFHERYKLSEREIEVTTLICCGKSRPEIAATLGTTKNTVKSQITSIYNKTGVNSKLELIRLLEHTSATETSGSSTN